MSNAKMFEIAFKLGATVDSSMRRAFNDASTAVENTGQDIEKLSKQNGLLSKTFNIAAKAASATGLSIAGIGAGIGAAIKVTDEYDTSMKQLQASTGASTEELQELKEISKNLYNKNLGEDWNDLAESIKTVKSVTDLSKESLETASKYALMYRDTFGEEVNESIKAADTMMRNFGITADQAYNLLAQGAQKGLNKSDELLDTANEYTPYFKTLGYTANEMFDIFNAGLKNGAFNLDKVGDAVKEFGIRVKDGSTSTNEALSFLYRSDGFEKFMSNLQSGGAKTKEFMELASKVGKENANALLKDLNKTGKASERAYEDIQWTMGGAGQFLDDLSSGATTGKQALDDIIKKIKAIEDPMTQSQIGVALFGTQWEDLETDTMLALGNVKSTFDMTKKTMDELGKIKYDTVGNAIKGIGRQLETGIVIPLGEKLLPHLNSLANYLANNLTQDIKTFKNTLSTIAPIVFGLTTAFLVYKGTLTGVGAAQVVFNAIQKTSIVLYRAHRAAMIAYAVYGGGLKGVIFGMRAAMVALNGTMLANPFLLVVAAIAGLVVAFYTAYKMSDTFRKRVNSVFLGIKNVITSSIGYITTVSASIWNGFINSTKKALVDGVFLSVRNLITSTKNYISAVSPTFWRGLSKGIEQLKNIYNQSIGYIGIKTKEFANWLNGLQGPAKGIVDYIENSFKGIGNTIATLSPLIARLAFSFMGVTGPIGWVMAAAISLSAFLYKLIKNNQEVQSAFINAWNAIKRALDPVVDVFLTLGKTLLATLMPAVIEIVTSFASLGPEFQKTGQVIKESFVQLGPSFAELGKAFSELDSTFISLFGQIASSVIPLLAQVFTSLLPVISQLFTTWITLSSTIATSVLPLLLSGVQMIFPMILSIVQSVLPFVVKLLGELIPVIIQIVTSVLPLILQTVQKVFPIILTIIQAVLPIVIQLITSIIPIVLLLVKTVLPLILQVVLAVFPIVLAIIQAVLPIVIQLIASIIPIVLLLVKTVLPLILQVVQAVFPIILMIIQAVLPVITTLLQGVAIFITAIVIPAIKAILAIVQFVFPLIMTAISNTLAVITGVLKTFTAILKGDWEGAWNAIKDTASTIMNNIINFFKSIKLYDIGKKMINGLIDGIKSMANKTMGAIGGIVNGVIKGLNWVLGKVGVEVSLKEWNVPKYAQGTKGHPGGYAILGDGGGPELFRTPNGALGLSPGTDTLMNLPKGTQVIPHRETQRILNEYNPAIPAYAKGNVQNPLAKGVNWIKEKASYAKNVFNNASNTTNAFSTANYLPQETLNIINNTASIPFYSEGSVIGNAFKTGVNWVKEKGSQSINAVKEGAGKVKDVALDVFSYIQDPSKLLSKVLEKYGVSIPDIVGPFGDIAKGSFTLIKEKATTFLKDKLEGFSGSWSGGTGAPGDVTKWLTAAINITGVPMSWLGPLQTMAMKESGGNPRAINLWDSNFKAGHPSKGLLQTIDSTFSAYKMPGMNDIWNPIHNAVASIRYTQSRYKSIFNTPGIASMAGGGAYKGYFQGGTVPNTRLGWVGERGPELMELPAGTQIRSHSDSNSILNNMISGMVSFANGESSSQSFAVGGGWNLPPIHVTFAPTIQMGDNSDQSLYDKILDALRTASGEFKQMLIQWLQDIENDKKRRDMKW
ncbi:phage tail tape measure protein [Niallia sp. 03190]|uniref:phage tail tape measure protein n=1 Tax=Niallia sp. 03190 TaxID=3458061 RepID=UPI004044142E